MTDLKTEFLEACCSITPVHLAALQAAGVPDTTFSLPMVGMTSIQTHSGGLFDIVDDGDLAVIVPVGEWDGLNWQLEDLIAFMLDDPTRWWRRLGAADVLGNVEGFTIEPKTLHLTPLDWLRAGGTGLVILDWSRDAIDLLQGAGPIAAAESLKNLVYAAAARSAARNVRNLFNER